MKDDTLLPFALPSPERMRRLLALVRRHEEDQSSLDAPSRRQRLLAETARDMDADAALLVSRSASTTSASTAARRSKQAAAPRLAETAFVGIAALRDEAAAVAARFAGASSAWTSGYAARTDTGQIDRVTARARAHAWVAVGNGVACVLVRRSARPFSAEEATGVALVLSVLLPPPSQRPATRRPHPKKSAPPVTPREQAVLTELLGGGSEKQVALKLQRSTHTIHSYVKRLYKRFNVTSRAELLARFVNRNTQSPKDPV